MIVLLLLLFVRFHHANNNDARRHSDGRHVSVGLMLNANIADHKLQIPESSRFLVGQYVTIHDDVISHVNITNVKEEDGGEYMCTAQNIIGKYVL